MPLKERIPPTDKGPIPQRPSHVQTGNVPKQDAARVYQGTDPWITTGNVNISESILPDGAATEATLSEMSAELRILGTLEQIDYTLKEILFILRASTEKKG